MSKPETTTGLLKQIDAAARSESLHLLVLSSPKQKQQSMPTKISVRPIQLNGTVTYQAAKRIGAQEFHENLEPASLLESVRNWISSSFDQLNVYTSEADFEFRRRKGRETIKRSKPSRKKPDLEHNRTRDYIIPEGTPCPFLIATGIMTEGGKVRAPKQKKFRQINRYLEIVSDVVQQLPEERPVRIVDFGCGRSYLTFALHHYFTKVLGRDVSMVGLDLKQQVIADCQRLAKELGCKNIEFQHGDIANHKSDESIDLCVSLHACNTATDEAIGQAVKWGCAVILAVPCCHHELAAQLENTAHSAMLRHGIMRERFAALATDTLRARALDTLGYRTQVIEFIDTEHTPKNLMIRAVRRTSGTDGSAINEYQQFRESLGIKTFHLENVVSLPGEE